MNKSIPELQIELNDLKRKGYSPEEIGIWIGNTCFGENGNENFLDPLLRACKEYERLPFHYKFVPSFYLPRMDTDDSMPVLMSCYYIPEIP